MSEQEPLKFYAWIGEDELGSGEVGIKRIMTTLGYMACCSHKLESLQDPNIVSALRQQAIEYGKTIRLVELREWDTVKTLVP